MVPGIDWRWQHWVLAVSTSLAVISASWVFAYLAGLGLWLEQLPPSFWLVAIALAFGLGLIGGGLAILRMEANLVRHIYHAAQIRDPGMENMEIALRRIILMLAANHGTEEARRRQIMAQAIDRLTANPIWDGQCKTCGATHPNLHQDPYNSALHHPNCPVPYARHLSQRERQAVTSQG